MKTVFILDKIGHHHPLLCLQQTFPCFLYVFPFTQLTNSQRASQLRAWISLFSSPLWWPSAVEIKRPFVTGATKNSVLSSETDFGGKRWVGAWVSIFQAAGLMPAMKRGRVSTKGPEQPQPGGRTRRAWMPSMCEASWTSPQAQRLKKKGNCWGKTCRVVAAISGILEHSVPRLEPLI